MDAIFRRMEEVKAKGELTLMDWGVSNASLEEVRGCEGGWVSGWVGGRGGAGRRTREGRMAHCPWQ